MASFVVFVILAVICGAAARYVYKARKKGVACIGCPAAAKGCGNCACSRNACCSVDFSADA